MTFVRGRYAFACIWLLYVFLVTKAIRLTVGVVLKLYLGMVKIPLAFALRLILLDWKTYILLAFAVLSAGVYLVLKGYPLKAMGGRPHWSVPLAVMIGAVLAVQGFLGEGLSAHANQYGFYPPFGMNAGPYVIKSGKPSIPDIVIKTNSFGCRDKDWHIPLRGKTRRALVVGDSFVWGFGIPGEEGMLHRRLEQELDAGDGAGWEVFNIASSPAALWYYVNSLIAFGKDVRPDLYVMSVVGSYDLEPWEVQRVKFGLPGYLVALMDACYVSKELMIRGAAIGQDYEERSRGAGEIDPEVLSDAHDSFSRLIAFIDATDARLIVWEGLDRPIRFFDRYRNSPRITFAGWGDVAELPKDIRWNDDETLAYKGDGHPTPKANGLIARTIARKFLGLRVKGVSGRWSQESAGTLTSVRAHQTAPLGSARRARSPGAKGPPPPGGGSAKGALPVRSS